MDARYEVAYREAVRSVDDQIRTVENIRGRAATLFSAAGVAVAVVGLVIRDGGDSSGGCALGFGVAGFVVLAAATVAIWWPTKAGQFLMDAGRIIGDSIETDDNPLDLDQLYRDLALRHDQHVENNKKLISRLFDFYVTGLVAFGVLIVALIVAVWEV